MFFIAKRKMYYLLFLLFALSIVVYGCGGGGGGGEGPTPPPALITQSITVSGSAIASPGLSSLVAGASLRKQQTGNPADSAQIVINSYDNKGNLLQTVETVSTASGGFSSNINIQSTGGHITVSALKDGFTKFEKTFTYKTIDDLKAGLQVLAEIDPVLTKLVDVSKPWNWTAALGDETISIAVMGDSRGHRQIVSGSGIKTAKASGGKVIWQLDLLRSVLKQQGVESLIVKINNYDPTNSGDARRFPSDTDNLGNTLVSAGFDYLDIKTNTGKPLVLSSSSLGTAAALSYKIKRRISDCSLINCDEDGDSTNGIQIGFYSFGNGKWKKLGNTTLYADPDNVDTPFTGSCTPGSEPYAVLTSTDVANLDLSGISWCNIDSVLNSAVAVCSNALRSGCIAGTVNSVKTDGSTEPEKGLYLYLSDLKDSINFLGATSYGYTKNDGSYRIDFTYTGTISKPTATVSYSDPFTWNWTSKDYALLDSNKDINGCYVLDLKITDPYGCEVKGKILKVDKITGAANKWAYVYQSGTYYGYKWAYTDSNGSYSIPVVCNIDYILSAEGETKNFNVNTPPAAVGADEKSDTGTVVEMKDITLANHAPQAYAYAYQTSVNTGDVVQLYGYGYDSDGDPLTYSWTKTCGTFDNASAQSAQYPKWTAPSTAPVSGSCSIDLKVSDRSSLSDTKTIVIAVSQVNRPPVITSIYVPAYVKANTQHTLYAYAYDPEDGSNVNYNWTAMCGTIANASFWNPSWTAPGTAPGTASNCTITLIVTDKGYNGAPSESTSKDASTTVYANRSPIITSINAPSQVPKNTQITLYSNAYDPDRDVITYNWSAICGTLANSTSQNPTWTAPGTVTTCNITLEVKDPDNLTASKAITISSVNTPPVITAFNVPDTAKVGDAITFSATATDADGDTLTYTWFIDSTQVGTGASYPWTAVEQGMFTVEVRVSDGINTVTRSKNVVVSGSTSVDIKINSLFNLFKGGE